MNTNTMAQRIGMGAAAGLTGTILIQGMLGASQKWAPQTLPPIKQDPGEFMVQTAERHLPEKPRARIPTELEDVAAKSLAFGYGATFGALYGASGPVTRNLLLGGGVLGLAAWAAGYLAWLPATGLMPPVTQQRPEQIAAPIVSHLVFGTATVGLYRVLEKYIRPASFRFASDRPV